ncbi:AGL173Wp [Eremothecium gossypii ATCC 10895]|uniref:Nuclear mRNA export factor n=1 Tax=Eremothecium gossypii (strain ATCC 10895 / CBS 109.51 / FGSC 9923 / NRRL Y-1056) TaxID=284811 RepID=Q750W2_EREGS|nr:AGL173Wp [Eremothecium gossypii ATCC 10895]AAS54318.1 AGL173Wp [Eremothecium gossypii ATCC 10895]
MASVGSLNPLANNGFKKKALKGQNKGIKHKPQKVKVHDKERAEVQSWTGYPQRDDRQHRKMGSARLSGAQDDAVGAVAERFSPETMGFQRFAHKKRETPRYMLQQTPLLWPQQFAQDPWDASNQKKMLSLEGSIADVTELWETLKKIRDVERKIMEQKGLVDRADFAKDLNDAIVFQGTCQDMCPIFERARRSVENNVVRYEKENPTDKRISRFRALKVFARPAAAAAPPLPSDVRPPHVLVKTLDYIVAHILQLLPDCESFLWDRMRSIRQDFTYQNYCGPEAIDCNERIVRIHLLILHVMARSEADYSRQQELEQLHKALITLTEIYDEVRAHGGSCPNEAEFRAYALLSRIRDPEYDKMIQELPGHIFNDDLVQLAICFRRVISNSSFIERGHIRTENCLNLYQRFFQLLSSDRVPFLMSSFLEVYVNEVRFFAMKALSLTLSKKHKSIPFQYFLDNLLFNSVDELLNFCKYYSIDTDEQGVSLKTLTHHSHQIPETKPLRQCYLQCIEEKLQRTTYEALINCGKPNKGYLPEDPGESLNSNFTSDMAQESTSLSEDDAALGSNDSNLPTYSESIIEQGSSLHGEHQDISKTFNFDSGDYKTTEPTTQSRAGSEVKSSMQFKPQQQSDLQSTKQFTAPFMSSVGSTTSPHILEETKTKKDVPFESSHRKPFAGNSQLKEENTFHFNQTALKLGAQTEASAQDEARDSGSKAIEGNELRNAVATELTDELIRTAVASHVRSEIEAVNKKTAKKKLMISILSDELFNAFIHETLYFVFLETRAESFYTKRRLKYHLTKWFQKYNSRKSDRVLRQKRKEELQEVSRQLGIPFLKRPRTSESVNSSGSNILGNSSFMKTPRIWVDTPVATETNHFNTPVRKNAALWQSIDLRKDYCDRIQINKDLAEYSDLLRKCDVKKDPIGLFVYSKNWNCISGSWLLGKFSLNENPSISVSGSKINMSVTKLCNDYAPSDFGNLHLLIFNTGVTDSNIFDLEMKMKQDGGKLIELVHGIALNTNYKFNILLIFWASADNPWSNHNISKYLKLRTISRLFGSVIQNIDIAHMNDGRPDETLFRSLTNVASNFKLELTERGEYNMSIMRRNLAGEGGAALMPFPGGHNDIDAKLHHMLQLESQKHELYRNKKSLYAHLQNHVRASPKAKTTKLPVLLSESNKNKFKTPLAFLPHRRSFSESPGSSLPSASSHLVAKVRHAPPPISTYGTPSHVRRPPQATNKLVFQTPSAAILGGSAGAPVTGTANTSGLSNITFAPPLLTPVTQMVLQSPPLQEQRNHPRPRTYALQARAESSFCRSDEVSAPPSSAALREAPTITRRDSRPGVAPPSYNDQPSSPIERNDLLSDNILELKGLIASVKSKLKH